MFWNVYEIIWVIGLLYSTNVTLISGLQNTIELVNQDIVLEIIVVFLYVCYPWGKLLKRLTEVNLHVCTHIIHDESHQSFFIDDLALFLSYFH